MKRLSLLVSVSVLGLGVLCAQTVDLQQVNQYAKQQYKAQWKSAAMSILPVLDLNEQGGYTYSTTIGMPNLSYTAPIASSNITSIAVDRDPDR